MAAINKNSNPSGQFKLFKASVLPPRRKERERGGKRREGEKGRKEERGEAFLVFLLVLVIH